MPEDHPVILFADRNLSWGRRARVEFRRRGARVLTAGSVAEGLGIAEESPPDVVILDGELDGKTGVNLAELFLDELSGSEIVFLESRAPAAPRGTGVGLLYSGPRTTAGQLLVGLAERVLGARLRRPPVQGDPRPRRILCVDDEEGFLRSMSRTLTRRGYRVSTFAAARRALEDTPVEPPDLALVDIVMPGMGGLELGMKLRERSGGKLPVVYLTALGSDGVRHAAHRHGGSCVVNKADVPERVVDVVDYFAGDLDDVERELLRGSLGVEAP